MALSFYLEAVAFSQLQSIIKRMLYFCFFKLNESFGLQSGRLLCVTLVLPCQPLGEFRF